MHMHVRRGGEARLLLGCFRAHGRHNKRKPEVAADRFWPRSVVDLEKAAARRDAAAARHGTAPDTKHGQTAWRPPVSFLPTPASRRPRTIHRPIRYRVAPPVRGMLLCAELVNDARSLIPSVIF